MTCVGQHARIFDPLLKQMVDVYECSFTLDELREQLQPERFDGDARNYTEREQASFAYAVQEFERFVGRYDRVFQRQIPYVDQRMKAAYTILKEKPSSPPPQIIWLTMEERTRERMEDGGQNPDDFLQRVAISAREYLSYQDEGKTVYFNARFMVSLNPPPGPHAEIIFTDTATSLVHTRERRLRAVKNVLRFGDERKVERLTEIIEQVRLIEPHLVGDDLYDRVGQEKNFMTLVFLGSGWTPIADDDIGNQRLDDLSFVKIDPENLAGGHIYGRATAHEFGHQFGLEHPFSTVVEIDETASLMGSHSVVGLEVVCELGEQAIDYAKVALGREK